MHHNYVGKLVKINLFDNMHTNMKKNKVFNLIKPSINEIAKYVPGESKISGAKNVIKLSSNESPFNIPKKMAQILNFLDFSSFFLFFHQLSKVPINIFTGPLCIKSGLQTI